MFGNSWSRWREKLQSHETISLFEKKVPFLVRLEAARRRPIVDIKALRELESTWLRMLSNRSRGTLMSYADRSAWHCLKSNTPHSL